MFHTTYFARIGRTRRARLRCGPLKGTGNSSLRLQDSLEAPAPARMAGTTNIAQWNDLQRPAVVA